MSQGGAVVLGAAVLGRDVQHHTGVILLLVLVPVLLVFVLGAQEDPVAGLLPVLLLVLGVRCRGPQPVVECHHFPLLYILLS